MILKRLSKFAIAINPLHSVEKNTTSKILYYKIEDIFWNSKEGIVYKLELFNKNVELFNFEFY